MEPGSAAHSLVQVSYVSRLVLLLHQYLAGARSIGEHHLSRARAPTQSLVNRHDGAPWPVRAALNLLQNVQITVFHWEDSRLGEIS